MASVKKRSDGVWRARYRDEGGKEHARHFKRKTDAQRWLDEVTASVVTGQYVDPRAGKLTLQRFFDEWSQRQVWAPRTYSHMETVMKSVTFADKPLKSIRPSDVESWVKKMQTDGLAPTTIANRLTAVRTIFRAALTDRRIASDPTSSVRTPRRPRREKSIEVPTIEQVGALLSATEPAMRAYVALGAFAGLRLGEISAVNIADIDFLRRTLHVERQVQYAPGVGIEIRDPKYGSKRDVYLADELVQILAMHVDQYGVSTEGWLFTRGSGMPIAPSTVDSWWQRTVRAAGVSGIHLHGLRHFFASGLIAAGCDVVTVQRALGHAKPSMTLDTYSHLWPSAEDRTRKAAGAMLADALSFADSLRTVDADGPVTWHDTDSGSLIHTSSIVGSSR